MSAAVSWIKVHTGTFDDEKIRLIEAMPDADALLVIWFKLLILAGKSNAEGHVTVINGKPVTDEMLSVLFNRPVNTVRLALQTFRDFEMIDDTDGLRILNWDKHQNIEGMQRVRELARIRKQNQREREKAKTQKLIAHVMSRDSHGIDIDLDNKEEEKYSPDILRLSGLLAEKILTNNPKHTRLSNGRYQETVEKWADAIDKLHRIDQQSLEDISQVIEWCQSDLFWKGNILSGAKLRKQWDQLYPKAVQQKPAAESWR